MRCRTLAATIRNGVALLGVCLGLTSGNAYAALTFTYQGRFLTPDGTAPLTDIANITFSIYNSSGTCLLEQEVFNGVDLSLMNGIAAVTIGTGTRTGSDPGLTMEAVLSNRPGVLRASAGDCVGGYSPSPTDGRMMQVHVDIPSRSISTDLTPSLRLDSVPLAYEAQKLQGYQASDFILAQTPVTQTNLGTLTNGSNADALHRHDAYVKVGSANAGFSILNGQTLGLGQIDSTSESSLTGLTAGSIWYNSTTQVLKYYDGANIVAIGASGVSGGGGGSATNFTGALTGDVRGTQSATVVALVSGLSAANVASGANAANNAASINTVNTLVKRDGSGNFSAGTITASNFIGAFSGTFTGGISGNAAGFTGALSGDVIGGQTVTVVSTVGGLDAASVVSGANAANAATAANSGGRIVARDGSGNFSAGIVTATLNGNSSTATSANFATAAGFAATATSAANFTGLLVGDVSGPQGATQVVTVGGLGASSVASGANAANAATSASGANTLVMRDASGNFSGNLNGTASYANFAGTATSALAVSGAVTASQLVFGVSANTGRILYSTDSAGTSAWNPLATLDAAGNLNANSMHTVGAVSVSGEVLTSGGVRFPDGSLQTSASFGGVTGFTGVLAGDVTGTVGATTVALVGGLSAANVASGAVLANAATATGTTGALVRRDASGNFSAGLITAALNGNAASATTASFATQSGSASSATTALYATSASTATSADYSTNAGTASSAGYATLAATATSASYATLAATATSAVYATGAGTATSASYATHAATASSADYATLAGGASGPITASSLTLSGVADGILRSVSGAVSNIVGASGAVLVAGSGGTPSFTSSLAGLSTIGASSGYFDAAVGIKTSSPAYPLDIANGAAAIAERLSGSNVDGPVIRFENTSARIYHVGSTATGSGAGNGFSIYDVTATAPRLLIDPSGNVGIGTVAPSSALHVVGVITASSGFSGPIAGSSGNFSSGLTVTGGSLTASSGASISGGINANSGGLTNAGVISGVTSISGAGNVTLSSGSSSNMTLTPSGNVGIGVANPQAQLQLANAVTGDPTIMNMIQLWSNGGSDVFGFGISNSQMNYRADNHVFFTPGTAPVEAMRIDSNRKVGIGTATPGALLHLASTGASAGQIVDSARSDGIGAFLWGRGSRGTVSAPSGSSSTDEAMQLTAFLHNGAGFNPVGQIALIGDGTQTSGSSPGAIRFLTTTSGATGSTERMRVDSNGNVGIGLAAPTAGLHIDRGATNNVALLLSSSGLGWGSGLQFVNTAPSGKSYGIYADTVGRLRFADNNAGIDRIIIDPNGNIGVGSFTPSQQLELTKNALLPVGNSNVNGNLFFGGDTSTGANGLRMFSLDALGGGFIDVKASSTDKGIVFRTDTTVGGTERMRITAAGNVGIGTTAPTSALHVIGVVTASSGFSGPFIGTTGTYSGLLTASSGLTVSAGMLTASSGATVTGGLSLSGGVTLSNNDWLQFKNSSGTPLDILNLDSGNSLRLRSGGGAIYINPDQNSVTALNYNNNQPVQVGNGTVPTDFIVRNGNVGIGTVTPASTLDTLGTSYFHSGPGSIAWTQYNINNNANFGSGAGISLAVASGINSPSGSYSYIWNYFPTGGQSTLNFYSSNVPTNSPTAQMTLTEAGSLGIGTPSPGAPLHVNGGTGSSNVMYLDSNYGGGQSTYMSFLSNGAQKWALGTGVSAFGDTFSIYDFNGAGEKNRLLIDTNGNVGIGTAAPTRRLDVWQATDGNIFSWSTTADSGQGGVLGVDTTNQAVYMASNSTPSYKIQFRNASQSPIMTLLNNGNVGIGTTSPQSPLEILDLSTGATPHGITIDHDSGLGGSPRIGFIDLSLGSSTTAPVWYVDNAADFFRIYRQPNTVASGTLALLINNAGNVGIGTSAPSSALHVVGTVTAEGGVVTQSKTASLTTADWYRFAAASSAGNEYGDYTIAWSNTVDGVHGHIRFLVQSHFYEGRTITVLSHSAYNLDRIDQLRVLIGPTNNEIHYIDFHFTGTPAATQFSIHANESSNVTLQDVVSSTIPGGYTATTVTTLNANFVNSGMTLLNGNVGIGTSNPGQLLSVAGTIESTTGGFKFPDGTTQTSAGISSSSGGTVNGALTVASGGLTVSSGGANITGGLTLAGTGPLSLAGGGGITNAGAIAGITSLAGTAGVSLSAGGTGALALSTAGTGAFTVATSGSTRMTVDSNGNVGIGTTNPLGILTVSDPTHNITTHIDGAGPKVRFGTTVAGDYMEMGAYANINQIDTKARDFRIYSTAAPSGGITVLQSTGNVGIGTTSPLAKLDVKFTGSQGLYLGSANANGGPTGNWYAQISDGTNEGYGGLKINTGWENVSNRYEAEPFEVQVRGNSLFNINSNGNVGIGTTAPVSKLNVFNSTTFIPNSNAIGAITLSGSYGGGLIFADGNFAGIWATDGGQSLNFATNGTSSGFGTGSGYGSMVFKNGNLGIGATSPTQRLSIVGAATASNQGVPANTGTVSTATLRMNGGVGGEVLDMGMNVTPSYAWLQATNSSALGTVYPLLLNPVGGNVGIGTTNPGQLLTVAGLVESTSGGFKFPDGTIQTTSKLYDVQCAAGSQASSDTICCKMTKSTGATSCVYSASSAGSWSAISGTAFSATTTGSYSLSMNGGSANRNFVVACRVNDNTGATSCIMANAWTSPTAWTSFSNAPF